MILFTGNNGCISLYDGIISKLGRTNFVFNSVPKQGFWLVSGSIETLNKALISNKYSRNHSDKTDVTLSINIDLFKH